MKKMLAAVAIAAVALIAGGIAAQADPPTTADEQQPLVEDFGYPDAARILADDRVELIAGDGHILYADCATPPTGPVDLIRVYTSTEAGMNDDGEVCFRVTAPTGLLTLRLPAVFEIRGDGLTSGSGHRGTAEVVAESGQRKTVNLDPTGSVQVGIGVPGGTPETLLRIEITG